MTALPALSVLATMPEKPAQSPFMLRCTIVDADPYSRMLLVDALTSDRHVRIVGDYDDAAEAAVHLAKIRTDAVFVDARMPMTRLRAVLDSATGTHVAVVVMSALPTDAVGAFDCDATDFLLKPFRRDRLVRTLERVRRLHSMRALTAVRQVWTVAGVSPQRGDATAPHRPSVESKLIPIATHEGTEYLAASAILCIIGRGSTATVFTTSGELTTSTSLLAFERMFDPTQFVRTHRCAIVNVQSARRLENAGTRGGELVLFSGCRLPVSKRRIALVRCILRRGCAATQSRHVSEVAD